MAIAGVDFSTRFVDVVLLDEDTDAATWHRFELFGNDAFDRARDVRRAMWSPASSWWDEILAVGIEQPRGNFGVTHMMRIQGAILACIPTSKLVQPWNPSDWRKTVGLPGNASKDDVSRHANALRSLAAAPYLPAMTMGCRVKVATSSSAGDWPQDACDAYCIALATRTLLQHGEKAA